MRNFRRKVGVLIQNENEAPLGAETRGEENGEQRFAVLSDWESIGERHELSQRGPRRSPDRKRFYCNLISADRLC